MKLRCSPSQLRRMRNVQKSVMQVQSCCFANINLSIFVVLHDNVSSHFSSLLLLWFLYFWLHKKEASGDKWKLESLLTKRKGPWEGERPEVSPASFLLLAFFCAQIIIERDGSLGQEAALLAR